MCIKGGRNSCKGVKAGGLALKSLGEYALNGNEHLQQVTIDSGVRFIGYRVLDNCHNLKKIISRIPDGSKVALDDYFCLR